MARLADRLMHERLQAPSWIAEDLKGQDLQESQTSLCNAIRSSQIVVADNVCEYVYAGTDQETWELTQDFPCLTPPFPHFWVEMRRPSRIVSRDFGEKSNREMPASWGFLFQGIHVEDYLQALDDPDVSARARQELEWTLRREWPRYGATIEQKLRQWHAAHGEYPSPETLATLLSVPEYHTFMMAVAAQAAHREKRHVMTWTTPTWQLQATLFMEVAKGDIFGPLSYWQFNLNKAGQVTDLVPRMGVYCGLHTPHIDAEWAGQFNSLIFPALLTISFFHCKNVSIVENEPPVKLNKSHQRRHGTPLVRFKTLDIHPMQQVLRTEGRADEHGLAKALHICRGHFKDYRQKGLFGRNFGIYWWDMHLRGQAEMGISVKDYAVHPA